MERAELLMEVLRLAQAEGALEGQGLEAFARALRERADLILAEHVRSLEEQVRSLEGENAWRRETIADLEEHVRSLESENAWRRETIAGQEQQIARLQAAWQQAAQAHEQLLAHHRQALASVAAELLAIAALPLHRFRQARRRLATLIETMRPEAS